jgi:asparagine synthase (glutamine-hydrolysing)
MCGFVGFTGQTIQRQQVLQSMMERIAHRGPDKADSFMDDQLALGFRRLSIIDLSEAGSQPMTNSAEDSAQVIVFNGEIYNYKQLRTGLSRRGHKFVSNTDTEVLLHGYEEYGPRLTERLRGMFSFVIYDKLHNRLFGARDPFGIKPLYYTFLADGSFLFASEIKSFLEHPCFVKQFNHQALRPYLCFQYNPLPETFFKGVYRLPHAHSFTYDLQRGTLQCQRYWDARFNPREQTLDQCVEHLHEVIGESVEAHRMADVAVGSFLSGGVDSSYITAMLKPDKTFSVGFADKGFDETVYAADLSKRLGIENFHRIIDPTEAFGLLPTIQYHLDEPDSNPSVVPLYFLARLAREHVTVVLSGEGGDELFAGYQWYADTPAMRRYKKLPALLRTGASSVAGRLPCFKGQGQLIRGSGRPEDWFIGQAAIFGPKEADKLLKPPYRQGSVPSQITAPIYARADNLDSITKMQYLDINLWQPGDILLKADKMSMAHSLELRVPYLDKEVMRAAEGIPVAYKIVGDVTKYALRKAAERVIPDEWAKRPKLGFPTPVRNWIKEEPYTSVVREYLMSDFAAEFFDQDALLRLLEDHRGGRMANGRKLWTVFVFLVWYRRFFRDEGAHPYFTQI